ncbi:hypothetical protein FFJ24_019720 [Pedobacter sp. KBS0701]|uniref:hypothetical protein n=1 Tax=Pedobacter sp. KBS0701 TaxID=2578106 RepID=UPI00110D3E35|nr:hypothetical protein [Pedobacter sp. KBS0701]QDW26923.1 hypothetical protein FFJ24_019720 [Pedobacter sp. KBS0701]
MRKKQKILAVAHLSTLNGANRSLLNLIEGNNTSIDWIVVCRGYKYENPSLKTELTKIEVKSYNIPYRLDVHSKSSKLIKKKVFFVIELIYNFFIALTLPVFAILKNVKILHSNSVSICLGSYVSFFIRKAYIWHFREFLVKDYRSKYNFGFGCMKFWADKSAKIVAISQAIHRACIMDNLLFNIFYKSEKWSLKFLIIIFYEESIIRTS